MDMATKTGDLFNISKLTHAEGCIRAELGINKCCQVFEGHFPGHPVVPGACMLQIVKDVMQAAFNNTLRLKKADHLKFLVMIDPGNTQTVVLDITYKLIGNIISVIAKLTNDEVVCFKFQGSFVKEEIGSQAL